MTSIGTFPFGRPVRDVVQIDRTLKRVFVLSVYASAVHARWMATDNKLIVNALAVASEPYIFWRGENAEEIIQQIAIPLGVGKLVTANRRYNGPSGIALDDLILKPLGLARSDAWLCDLVPHSCVNPSQNRAIVRAYLPIARKYGLPTPTVPTVPKILSDELRQKAIMDEIYESGADLLILLGDKPIQWFLLYFDQRWHKLAHFMRDSQPYGKTHIARIGHKDMKILPLAHPRQVAQLGQSSAKWHDLHQIWAAKDAGGML